MTSSKQNGTASHFDLAVIGSGMAGMAASLYAANRGLSVVQIGNVGGTLFATGLFDLMAVHPMSEKKIWTDPWLAIEALKKDVPNHPYAKLTRDSIEAAFKELLAFFNMHDLPYHCANDRNFEVITSMGTVKHTFCVPDSMWHGVLAYEAKAPALIVDFQGLREYSGVQIVSNLGEKWKGLRSTKIPFPGRENKVELFTAHLAQDLELESVRIEIVKRIENDVLDAKAVGFPAVLGVHRTNEIAAHFQELLKVPVFEIPTMPTSVPGLRIKRFFDTHLPSKNVARLIQKRVERVLKRESGFSLVTRDGSHQNEYMATNVILATGRFMGKGLVADRKRVRESIFDLPVYQPLERKNWHSENFVDPKGHEINLAGVETDATFRPLGEGGRVFHENLYAIGSILAHQDWVRMKCGTGLAIATAYGAVTACCGEKTISSANEKDSR